MEYKELVARCLALQMIYNKYTKFELRILNVWIAAYKQLYNNVIPIVKSNAETKPLKLF